MVIKIGFNNQGERTHLQGEWTQGERTQGERVVRANGPDTWKKSQRIQCTPRIVRKYTRQNSQLKLVIDYYNQQLELINRSTSTPVPKISKDLIITSKKRRLSRTKQKINFKKLLFDGIHPKRPIARLWMHIIVRFARLQNAHE